MRMKISHTVGMWSRQLLARTRSRGLSTLAGSRPTCTALATASSSVCWVPRRLANTAPRTQESDCEQDVTFSEDTATANLLSDLAPSEVNIEQEQLPPFEGPEKLLELWFSSDHAGVNSSLRDIPADVWQKCLDEVQCTILSTIQNEHVTAYLLSESSMFVYADKVLIKTCGTTTLLKCLPGMIELAKTRGLNVLEDVFYSRQSFNFPDRQLYPHKSVDQEVDYLSREFKQGAAYCLGRLNESNYNFFNAETATPRKEADSSLEVMMTGLDDELMQKHFFKDTFCDKTTFKASGIGGLFENAIVDEYAFEPCGYSMNGPCMQRTCSHLQYTHSVRERSVGHQRTHARHCNQQSATRFHTRRHHLQVLWTTPCTPSTSHRSRVIRTRASNAT